MERFSGWSPGSLHSLTRKGIGSRKRFDQFLLLLQLVTDGKAAPGDKYEVTPPVPLEPAPNALGTVAVAETDTTPTNPIERLYGLFTDAVEETVGLADRADPFTRAGLIQFAEQVSAMQVKWLSPYMKRISDA
jgi:hypothetical protein